MSWDLAVGSASSRDHLKVPLPLVCRLLRCLSGLLAVLVRSDLSKDAELLVLRQGEPALNLRNLADKGLTRRDGAWVLAT